MHHHPELFLARNSVFELILSIETIVDMWRSSFPKSFGQTEQVTGGIRLVTVVTVNRNRNRPYIPVTANPRHGVTSISLSGIPKGLTGPCAIN